nr:DAR GTPase 3, chloroplastic [Tanacetum cinerariifolium]
MKLGRLAKSVAAEVNIKRRARGLLPRAVSWNSWLSKSIVANRKYDNQVNKVVNMSKIYKATECQEQRRGESGHTIKVGKWTET